MSLARWPKRWRKAWERRPARAHRARRRPGHVVTLADFGGAREHGVRFSSGDAGRAVHALGEIGELIESGRFSLPVAQTFPLAEVAEAHRVSEHGHVRGKLVLLAG
jgi:NADPH:quinone reductase-like Zn-dependent oxidoreductase